MHICVHTSACVCYVHVPEHVCGLGPAADTEQVLPHLTLLTALLPWLSLSGGLFAGPATSPWEPVEGAPQASRPPTAALLHSQLSCRARPGCRLSALPSPSPAALGGALSPPPDGHQPHQGPARVVDLGPGALHVAPLLTGLEVLPPASICHLSGQQEVAGLGDLCTGSPAETSKTRDTIIPGEVPAPALALARPLRVTERGAWAPALRPSPPWDVKEDRGAGTAGLLEGKGRCRASADGLLDVTHQQSSPRGGVWRQLTLGLLPSLSQCPGLGPLQLLLGCGAWVWAGELGEGRGPEASLPHTSPEAAQSSEAQWLIHFLES